MGDRVEVAAMKAGMSRRTGDKFKEGPLPSESKKERGWRTREDPFAADWPEIEAKLKAAPTLQAKILFDDLIARHEERYEPGQVRSLQRRIKEWRAQEGPDKEVFFAQIHQPGEAAQVDFTWATELEITIRGLPFDHLLCHLCLVYSRWSWATICHSESIASLKHGIQEPIFKLGRAPEFCQSDNSTGATHEASKKEGGGRAFNEKYVELMNHLGMQARTIAIGKSNQNGSIESLNGALKNELEQYLLLRRDRDFDSLAAYREWLEAILEKRNRRRETKLKEELERMHPIPQNRMLERERIDVRVTQGSTIRVKRNTYSVPSRLIGESVRAYIYTDRIEVMHGGKRQLTIARLQGDGGHKVDYRHCIGSLIKKPGAFRCYRYFSDMFPSVTFRRAYDALLDADVSRWEADVDYLRILHRAATTMESLVESALLQLLEEGVVPRAESVKRLVPDAQEPEVPDMPVPIVDLISYDDLLTTSTGGFCESPQ